MSRHITWKEILAFCWYYWRRSPLSGMAAVTLLTAALAADTFVPVFTGKIVDALAMAATGDKEAGLEKALLFSGAVLALGLFYQMCRWGAYRSWLSFSLLHLYNILTEAMFRVQRFSADWHENNFGGATVRKITRGMWAYDAFADTIFMGLYPAIVIMGAMSAMLLWQLPVVGVFAVCMITIYVTLSVWCSLKILVHLFREAAEKDTDVGASLADIITGNATVKAFGAEGRERDVFRKRALLWRGKAKRAWEVAENVTLARGLLRETMLVGMLGLTVWLWFQGKASIGDLALALNSFFIISGYMRDIGMHITNLQKSVSEMEDIVGFWSDDSHLEDSSGAAEFVPGKGHIVFDKVCFSYKGSRKRLFSDLSLQIEEGERVALVGESGSGKSSFVKLLLRLYDPQSGAIYVDGQSVTDVKRESLRSSIALVPQDPILFHRSLAENIAYGNPGADMDEVERAARKAYAHDFIRDLPQGYDTLVGERGVKLSGGERQRVAIARAILADTPVFILDEATSALDSLSEYYIQRALENAMRGRTTITIAHRLSTIQDVDRIIVFDKGCIVEQGSHNELMAQKDSRYKKLWDMQTLPGAAETPAEL